MGFLMVKERLSLLLTNYLRTIIQNCKDELFTLRAFVMLTALLVCSIMLGLILSDSFARMLVLF